MTAWGQLRTADALQSLRMTGRYSFTTPCERCGGSDRVTGRLCFVYDADLCIKCTREFYVVCNSWPEQKDLLKVRDMNRSLGHALSLAMSTGSLEVPHISSEVALTMDRFIEIEGRCFLKAKAWVEEHQAKQPDIQAFRNASLETKAQIVVELIVSATDDVRTKLLDLLGCPITD